MDSFGIFRGFLGFYVCFFWGGDSLLFFLDFFSAFFGFSGFFLDSFGNLNSFWILLGFLGFLLPAGKYINRVVCPSVRQSVRPKKL